MTTISFRIAILATCFLQAGCFSAMLNIGGATSGEKVEPHERVVAAAADVVTSPIQVPLLLALDSPTLPGKSVPEQSEEEKEASRKTLKMEKEAALESQKRERMRRLTGY